MSTMFLPLGIKSTIMQEIIEEIQNGEEWQPYYNFMAKQVPDEVIQKDPFLRDLYEREPFIAGVTMMNPMSLYDWHVDEKRGATINMLVESGFSLTMFTTPAPEYVRPFAVAEYAPEQYHIFNTQIPHTVYNFDRHRFLFTLEFAKGKDELDADGLAEIISDMEDYGFVEA